MATPSVKVGRCCHFSHFVALLSTISPSLMRFPCTQASRPLCLQTLATPGVPNRKNLVEAWFEHCDLATPTQFSSMDMLGEHLNHFTGKVVQQGFIGSMLDGNKDIQSLIAESSSANNEPLIPPAEAPNRLSKRRVSATSPIELRVCTQACPLPHALCHMPSAAYPSGACHARQRDPQQDRRSAHH